MMYCNFFLRTSCYTKYICLYNFVVNQSICVIHAIDYGYSCRPAILNTIYCKCVKCLKDVRMAGYKDEILCHSRLLW